MNRRTIRRRTFLIAALLILAGLAADQYAKRRALERAVSNSYLHAFAEAAASVEQMDRALKKGVYVTSAPMLCSLCDEVYAQSKSAQMALGQLPLSSETLRQTTSFVATLGDYAYALSRTAALSGDCPKREDWQTLSQAAAQLSDRMAALELELNDGSLTLDNVEAAQARLSSEQPDTRGDAFQQVEAEFPETPSLIYDGPFSQHLTGRTPAMTEGQPTVTEQDALTIARRATGWTDLAPAGSVEGALACFTFTDPTGTKTVQITRQGGCLCTAVSHDRPAEAVLTDEEAHAAAADQLARLGFADMAESYAQHYGNTMTVNFCYAPEGVRIYPDLVKVSVSLSDGSLTGFEAQGYLTNHRERSLPEAAVDADTARSRVSPLLRVLGEHLSVIPSRGEHEVLCWEFTCENESGEHVVCYVNAVTGAEEKLLLLVEDETGTLAV